jgi:hypothetical protein
LFRFLMILLGCAALTACGDPLAKVERLSDVPVSEDQTVALALPVRKRPLIGQAF